MLNTGIEINKGDNKLKIVYFSCGTEGETILRKNVCKLLRENRVSKSRFEMPLKTRSAYMVEANLGYEIERIKKEMVKEIKKIEK